MAPQNNSILTQMENYASGLTSLPGGSNVSDIDYTPSLVKITSNEKLVQSGQKHKIRRSGSRQSKTTDAITDPEDIKAAKEYFLSHNARDYFLFVLGINCGRRIGDILLMKMGDILCEDGSFNYRFDIYEEKTGKPFTVMVNNSIREAFEIYAKTLKEEYSLKDYLFMSRQTDSCGKRKAISREQAHNILVAMSKAIGLNKKGIHVGTHTMRKTAAMALFRKSGNDIMLVKNFLNHEDVKTTQCYLGLDQTLVRNAQLELNL